MLSVDKALQSPLLSPPTSPRMSTYATGSESPSWQQRQTEPRHPAHYAPFPSLVNDPSRYQPGSDSERPPLLRSHKSVPTFLEPAYTTSRLHGELGTVSESRTTEDVKDKPQSSPVARSEPSLTLKTSTIGTSPAVQLTTPTSPVNNHDSSLEDEAVMGEIDDDDDVLDSDDTKEMSRLDKRKMKRFRLTHQQTRFLMSEFSRQAHPDAAHRERLAREIPGLSPRQVQVWFQNRRAKMKRLTVDDQERMLKSRALPEDFDMSQALHSPYGGGPMIGTPMASPVSYVPPYGDSHYVRPLMIDNLRRQSDDDSNTSPLSLHSAYGSNFYTPPTSDNVSPISTTSDRHFGTFSSSQASPRSGNPFMRSGSFSSAYQQQQAQQQQQQQHHHQIPRLQLQDRANRSRAESLQSPLRSSITYSSNALDYGEDRRPAAEQPNSASPYGLGHQNPHLHGFQNSAMSRMRPMQTAIPPGLQLKSEYRPSPPTATPHAPSFPMQSAPLAPPSDYQPHYPQLSAPYHTSSFGHPYGQQTSNVSPVSLPSSSVPPFNAPHDASQSQRPPQETSPRVPAPSSNGPTQTHFEIPRRSFTYDYGSQPQ